MSITYRPASGNLAQTFCNVIEQFYQVTEQSPTEITVNNTDIETGLEVDYYLFTTTAETIAVTPYRRMSSAFLQAGLEELSEDFFNQGSEPGSAEEGDLWYDIDDNLLKIYKHVSVSVLEWVTLAGFSTDVTSMSIVDSGTF